MDYSSLPSEMVEEIFSKLNVSELLKVSATDSRSRKIAYNTIRRKFPELKDVPNTQLVDSMKSTEYTVDPNDILNILAFAGHVKYTMDGFDGGLYTLEAKVSSRGTHQGWVTDNRNIRRGELPATHDIQQFNTMIENLAGQGYTFVKLVNKYGYVNRPDYPDVTGSFDYDRKQACNVCNTNIDTVYNNTPIDFQEIITSYL